MPAGFLDHEYSLSWRFFLVERERWQVERLLNSQGEISL
jgi:hypothetical protein